MHPPSVDDKIRACVRAPIRRGTVAKGAAQCHSRPLIPYWLIDRPGCRQELGLLHESTSTDGVLMRKAEPSPEEALRLQVRSCRRSSMSAGYAALCSHVVAPTF